MIFSAPTLYTPIYHRYLSKLVLASFKYTTLSQHASRIFPKKCLPFLFENRSQISVNLESATVPMRVRGQISRKFIPNLSLCSRAYKTASSLPYLQSSKPAPFLCTNKFTLATMSNLSVTEARAKLSSHFSSSTFQGDSDNYGKGWEALWQKGDFLPWDRLAPSPALVDTLQNHQSVIGNHEVDGRRKKALVPGCGRGVDVLLLESYGYDAVGLEYSAKAIEECEKFASERGGEYETKVSGGSRKFVQGDFYKDDWLEKLGMSGQKFDLIYDYTVSRNVSVLSRVWV